MYKNRFFILVVLLTIIMIFFGVWGIYSIKKAPFAQRRSNLLVRLDSELKEAEIEGNYKCCIEPLCKMCYLGNWVWDDGICRCDDEIASNNWDRVCPECIKGIEEGRCKSSKGVCPENYES